MSKIKISLIVTAAVLVLGGTGYAYMSMGQPSNKADRTPVTTDEPDQQEDQADKESDINTNPTDSSDDSSNSTDDANQNNSKKDVNPTISTWGQNSKGNLEVNGFVAGIIESDGVCTLTLTKSGDNSVSQTKKASPDAQTTTCGLMTISGSKLSPGTWKAVLGYSSSTSSGKSRTVSIEVD